MRAGDLLRNINGLHIRGKLRQLGGGLEEKGSFLYFPLSQSRHLMALQTGAIALLLGSLGLSLKKRRETVPSRDGKQPSGNHTAVASEGPHFDSSLVCLCAAPALSQGTVCTQTRLGQQELPGQRGSERARVRASRWPWAVLAARRLGLGCAPSLELCCAREAVVQQLACLRSLSSELMPYGEVSE